MPRPHQQRRIHLHVGRRPTIVSNPLDFFFACREPKIVACDGFFDEVDNRPESALGVLSARATVCRVVERKIVL